MTAIKRVDVVSAARHMWWTKKGDLLASAVAVAALLAAGLAGGALPLAATLAGLVAGNVLRLWVRELPRQAEYRSSSAYFSALFEKYGDVLIGDAPDV